MLDKLLDFILTFIKDILPFTIVDQWDRGVILRLGKFYKVLEPGFYLKIPFADTVHTKTVTTTTHNCPTQSLTTKDGKQLVVKGVVKYSIFDIKAHFLGVYDSVDAIGDTAQAIIKEQIITRTWDECRDPRMDIWIKSKLRLEVKRWGIDVEKLTLTSLGLIRSIRLFNETEQVKNE